MTILNYSKYDSLCVCGDIHGEFKALMFNIKRFGVCNSVIIVAGDCGIGFEKEAHYAQLYSKLSKTLEATNTIILLVRGNHDDPAYFDGVKIDFERMKCIPDYSVVCVADRKVFCIGGAVSIDRKHRKDKMWIDQLKNGKNRPLYWEDEAVIFNAQSLSELQNMAIDTVITHTCPSFCYPVSKAGIESWILQDTELLDDLNAERDEVDKIYYKLLEDNHPIKSWYYAHFHQSHTEYINNISFSLLTIMEIKEIQ
ncbi:MAG: metallophosphoesterase [Phocaeicola sp.]